MKRLSYFLLKLSIIIFTLHCSIFTVNCCYAQKVAVVLSGGGTKGLAHIGVLKALEENHIPIDYIAGTSIGAVVAGLYASGYSPDSIEKIFMSDEVVKWVRGDIDEKYIYYFKMPDPNASWASIRFDYNKGWIYNLPTNLISPVMMDFAFNEIFSGADAEADYKFDSLFVPFRCVASDISDNKPFIFRYGDLGQAIRASMTVPFLFSPIKVNGKLMFDGGMYDNFPADVVYKDFNPDYIIGSQVTHPEEIPKENDIMSQIYSMLMNKSSYSAICDNSIIIKPDVPHSYSLIYFDQRQQYIDSGYTATIRALKSIRLAVTAKSSPSDIMAKRKAFNKKKPPLLIDSIFISGVNKNQQKYILKSLHYSSLESSPSSSKITLDDFKKNYFRLISDERIEHIATRLKYNKETGYYDMYLDVTKQKRFTAQFGGLVSSNPVNEAFIGLQYNTLSADAFGANVNSYFGKFYNSVEGNARLDLPSRLPLFLEASSSYSQWDYFNTSSYFVTDKTPSYLFQYDTHSELNIGIPLSNKGKLELGAEYAQLTSEYYQTNNFSRLDTADQNTFDLVSVDLLFERNSLNFKQFPNSGTRFYSELRYVSGTETNYPGSIPKDKQILSDYHHWFQYHLSYENYFKTFGDLKLGYYTELHLSNQDNFNNYTASILAAPAFQPTPDSKTGFNPNYRAYNYGGAGIKSIYMFTRSLDIRVEAYIFQPYKEILSDNNMDAIAGKPFQKHYYIGMAALVFQTPIGPLSLSLNYYDKSNLYEDRFSVVVSFGYVIFNRRALD